MKVFTFLLVLLLVGCHSLAANIFGPDKRRVVKDFKFPFNMMGKLVSSQDLGDLIQTHNCTASLVREDIVLTSLHCIGTILANHNEGDVVFKLGYNQKKEIDSSPVTGIEAVYKKTARGIEWTEHLDFALLKLKIPLGKKYGWFKVAPHAEEFIGDTVSMAGYSGDKNYGESLTVHEGCQIHEIKENLALHDCAATQGGSGGPIYKVIDAKTAIIVAIHAGAYTGQIKTRNGQFFTLNRYDDRFANFAVLGDFIVSISPNKVETP